MSIKIRFKGTYLGILWAVLEPLFMFLLLYVVFTSIRTIPKENFAVYLIIGVLFFHLFSRGTTSGLRSLRDNSPILKSLDIRRELFPVATTLATGILMIIEIALFFAIMLAFGFVPSISIVALPLLMGLLLVLILGLSYILSIVNAFVRDIQQFWAIVVTTLMFISPVFWYLDEAADILLIIHKFNPFGQLLELSHEIIFGGIPALDQWLYPSLFVFGIFIVGYALFQKFESKIIEDM